MSCMLHMRCRHAGIIIDHTVAHESIHVAHEML